jgi:enoyl-[acyl-carrier-protein] reductase (NADH)
MEDPDPVHESAIRQQLNEQRKALEEIDALIESMGEVPNEEVQQVLIETAHTKRLA